MSESEKQAPSYVVVDKGEFFSKQFEQQLQCQVTTFRPEELLNLDSISRPSCIILNTDTEYSNPVFETLSGLKDKWPSTPIILVTSTPDQPNLALMLASGADDFLVKGFTTKEFKTRVKVETERLHQQITTQVVDFGDIVIDARQRAVTGPKGRVMASPIELNLLNHLAASQGSYIKKEALKIHCWGQIKVTDNALHRKLHAARQLLKEVSDEVQIRTKYGVGFTLAFQVNQITKLAS